MKGFDMKLLHYPYVTRNLVFDPDEFFGLVPNHPEAMQYNQLHKEHVETTVGTIEKVVQSYVDAKSTLLGVLVVPPTTDSNFYTLMTSGMSLLPMTCDPEEECDTHLRAELYMCLPPDWKLDEASLNTYKWGWPVAWLTYLAKLPHVLDFRVGWGDSFALHPKAERGSMGDSRFNGCILLTSMKNNSGIDMPEIDAFLPIHYYNLFPVYKEELEGASKPGNYCTESVIRLQQLLIANGLNGPLDIKRKNVVTNEVPNLQSGEK